MKDLENTILNVMHTHICLRLGDLEELAQKYLEESQRQKSYKLAYYYLGKREMVLDIINRFYLLEAVCRAKSGLI